MRFDYYVIIATNTHTISLFIYFPRQKLLRGPNSILFFMHITCFIGTFLKQNVLQK